MVKTKWKPKKNPQFTLNNKNTHSVIQPKSKTIL